MKALRRAIEIAWAAGFFDGEGNVHVEKRHDLVTPRLRLNVAQVCDTQPLERFVAAVGAGTVRGPHLVRGERRRYAVDIGGPAAHRVMELLRPYLTDDSKKIKAYLAALDAGATPNKTNGWATGARKRGGSVELAERA